MIGIFKAYCTRVGSGPFPTELHDELGERMRQIGHEFGSTTGRARRCGWVDLPALRYTCMINGVTKLIMMKADVLSGFNPIRVCTSYQLEQDCVDFLPYDINETAITPVYEDLPGWSADLTGMHAADSLPAELKNYIQYLESQLEIPIVVVSVGPDREQTIHTGSL